MNVLRMYANNITSRHITAFDHNTLDDDSDYFDTIQEQETVKQARAGVRRNRMMRHEYNL